MSTRYAALSVIALFSFTTVLYGQRVYSGGFSTTPKYIRYSYGESGDRVSYMLVREKVRMDNCRKAILQDDPELLRKAMGKNFKINVKYPNESLLQFAVRSRKIKCIQFILSLNPDVNCTDNFGHSPLFLCSRDNDAHIARMLVGSGAGTYHQDRVSKWNVFHKAASENSGLDTLQVLMQDKSGLNAHDINGLTPLHLAVSRTPHASLAVVEFLLRNGAYVNAVDKKGRTPLDMVRQKDIVNCLLSYGAVHGYSNSRHRTSMGVGGRRVLN
ncbi:MAG: ankyrin repeat domain-containing protein [Lentisphaeria bacterium]|nr:ankyrin repeat domain-containing protein [Lentisphaeria bacterium]